MLCSDCERLDALWCLRHGWLSDDHTRVSEAPRSPAYHSNAHGRSAEQENRQPMRATTRLLTAWNPSVVAARVRGAGANSRPSGISCGRPSIVGPTEPRDITGG